MTRFNESGLQIPSLVDAVYDAIRQRILTGQLQGGSRLTELDLASHYSVARPTAKSAMERLVHEGLLHRATNKTARVPVMTSEDIRDLYFSRTFLEREVMSNLASRRRVPEAARASVRAMRELANKSDVSEVVRLDIAFHRALFDEIGSPRLNRLYLSLMGEVHLCMAQVQANKLLAVAQIADEHAMILAAIDEGSEERATAEISAHLARACERLVRYVTGDADEGDAQGPMA